MSTKEREPLLSDEEIEQYAMMYTIPTRYEARRALKYAKAIYEAAGAKDAELIQMAVNLTYQRVYEWTDEKFRAVLCTNELAFLSAAKEAGFTPSEP